MLLTIFFYILALSNAQLTTRDRQALCSLVQSIPALGSLWGGTNGDSARCQTLFAAKDPCGGANTYTNNSISCTTTTPKVIVSVVIAPEAFPDHWPKQNVSGYIHPDFAKLSSIPASGLALLKVQVGALSDDSIPDLSPLFNCAYSNTSVPRIIDFSRNSLTGTYPEWITNCPFTEIYLSENRFSGTLPSGTFRSNFGTPLVLNIGANRFSGQVPKSIGFATNLREIRLDANEFSGPFPTELGRCLRLSVFAVSDNKFTGPFPNITSDNINYIAIDSNRFSGTIPADFPPALSQVSVFLAGDNIFTGKVSDRTFATFYIPNGVQLRGECPTCTCSTTTDGGGGIPGIIQRFFGGIVTVILGGVSDVIRILLGQGTGQPYHPVDLTSDLLDRSRLLDFSYNRLDQRTYYGATRGFVVYEPQDINECQLGTHDCNLTTTYCSDGWNPRGSFTCSCLPGWRPSASPNQCEDIDECKTGDWMGVNGGKSCLSRDRCINLPGTFTCCNQWFTAQDDDCVDIDECYNGTWSSPNASGVSCSSKEKCANYWGGFYCCEDGYVTTTNENCEDINECENNLWRLVNKDGISCKSRDHCVNTVGSFYCCPDGTRSSGTECYDIDDCLEGLDDCPNSNECVNVVGGTFRCCPAGYVAKDGICVDVNECLPGAENICGPYRCQNTVGSYVCCNSTEWNPEPINGTCIDCRGEWKPVPSRAAYTAQSFFEPLAPYYNTTDFNISACEGSCDDGLRFYTRDLGLPCSGLEAFRRDTCSFPCKGLSTFDTSATAITTLINQLQKGGFIEDVFFKIWGIEAKLSQKRLNGLIFDLGDCRGYGPDAGALLMELAKIITPMAPNLALSQHDCQIEIVSEDPGLPPWIPILVAIIVGLVLLFLLVALVYFISTRFIRGLPEGVAWSYQAYLKSPWGWTFRGTREAGYYFKELSRGTELHQRAMQLWVSLRPKKSTRVTVERITAVYNPTLVNNFIGTYKIFTTRSSNELFSKQTWLRSKDKDFKTWVWNNFECYCNQFDWNREAATPIIPMLHGTDEAIAEKICETGFAALSSLDAGFFGKGIYFTSWDLYTLPYIVTKTSPAILLSYIVPGNSFPVTEGHRGPKTLLGKALQNGYASHYVNTTRTGDCLGSPVSGDFYDEMVVPQESQIAPAFIFHVSAGNIPDLMQSWSSKSKEPRPTSLSVSIAEESQTIVSLDETQSELS